MRVAVVAVPSFTVWQPQDYFHETSPKSCFFLCSSSFSLALFRACLDCDTSRKSLHCQGQQAAVFEMPSKPNYSMTPTGVSHGTKWHGEVGSRHGSVLHFLEGWNSANCPELPEDASSFSQGRTVSPQQGVSLFVPTCTTEIYSTRSQDITCKCK